MSNEYREAFNQFNESLSENGIDLFNKTLTVYTAQGWFDNDEAGAEEDFSNYLDNEGFDLLVSLEDCLNGSVDNVLEEQVYNSFTNGQHKQAFNQFEELNDQDEFLDWLKGDELEAKILRFIVGQHY